MGAMGVNDHHTLNPEPRRELAFHLRMYSPSNFASRYVTERQTKFSRTYPSDGEGCHFLLISVDAIRAWFEFDLQWMTSKLVTNYELLCGHI